ncbi:AraC family transcriptional regulator [Paenibacillus lemnae]|uniref:AraC family transcriptional regulator n=1 Tax=Paenibacillus lemnae TaxID=1330551 RepID=A0A848M6M6_PAELE|nr:AraC family transcriptional regulator [Paenibacillus lemnae]NMO96375.1 AraC family transcriptional regulator [Paenibacillus lemnae]
MTILQFTAPPLPHYIISGMCEADDAFRHPNRRNIGVFDLLVVQQGCLYVTENEVPYEIREGSFLILRPDTHHYPTRDSSVGTQYYWLHFNTTGCWHAEQKISSSVQEALRELQPFSPNYFPLKVPQSGSLPQPQKAFELLLALSALVKNGHRAQSLWRQQLLFQELLELLAAALDTPVSLPSSCAEKAAAYLREHFREEFKAQELGERINFHPVYIARCMQKEFGFSPVEYLIRYRIEQAKLLLMQTDQPISRIAEEVGFNHAAYFTSCFARQEGMSPRKYRQKFV